MIPPNPRQSLMGETPKTALAPLKKGGTGILAPLVKLCISHIFCNNLEALVKQGLAMIKSFTTLDDLINMCIEENLDL
jgi:hypothetical protein